MFILSKRSTVDDFVNQAKIVKDTDFLALVKCVILLLTKEQKAEKSKLNRGRLVRLLPSGEATIVGDLHGDLESLEYILKDSCFVEKAQRSQDVHLIFLGDYGDRGSASPEVYSLVLRLKELFPDKVILMRGNHEGPEDMLPYSHDLPNQIKVKYGEEAGANIMVELRRLFDHLYTAVIIEDSAVLIHGGLPSKAESIRALIYAHKKHPEVTYLEEMLWSDPQEDLLGTELSPRGAGRFFGADVTKKLLKMLNVMILIRGHESSPEGYKINHNGKVLTLFSTNKSPYTNKHAAYLQIDLSSKIKSAHQLKKYIKQFE
jgi:protein phosphatase